MTTYRRFSKPAVGLLFLGVSTLSPSVGRSWGAPYLAGVVACGLHVNPDLPIDQIGKLLCDSGWDFQRGKLLNPRGFLDAARGAGSNDFPEAKVPRAVSKGQHAEGTAR